MHGWAAFFITHQAICILTTYFPLVLRQGLQGDSIATAKFETFQLGCEKKFHLFQKLISGLSLYNYRPGVSVEVGSGVGVSEGVSVGVGTGVKRG